MPGCFVCHHACLSALREVGFLSSRLCDDVYTLSLLSSLTLLMAEWLNRTPEVMGNIEGTHRWDADLEARRQLPSCRQDLHWLVVGFQHLFDADYLNKEFRLTDDGQSQETGSNAAGTLTDQELASLHMHRYNPCLAGIQMCTKLTCVFTVMCRFRRDCVSQESLV